MFTLFDEASMIQAMNYLFTFMAVVFGVAFLAILIMWCMSILLEIIDDSRRN